jgi:hypothetical protein
MIARGAFAGGRLYLHGGRWSGCKRNEAPFIGVFCSRPQRPTVHTIFQKNRQSITGNVKDNTDTIAMRIITRVEG